MDSDQKKILLISESLSEVIDKLSSRPPSAVATALVFAMAEVISRHHAMPTHDLIRLQEILDMAGEEALHLVDGVYMSNATDKEVIH